jgi:hypothetical protein
LNIANHYKFGYHVLLLWLGPPLRITKTAHPSIRPKNRVTSPCQNIRDGDYIPHFFVERGMMRGFGKSDIFYKDYSCALLSRYNYTGTESLNCIFLSWQFFIDNTLPLRLAGAI